MRKRRGLVSGGEIMEIKNKWDRNKIKLKIFGKK